MNALLSLVLFMHVSTYHPNLLVGATQQTLKADVFGCSYISSFEMVLVFEIENFGLSFWRHSLQGKGAAIIFCFSTAEISYWMVGLFHGLHPSPPFFCDDVCVEQSSLAAPMCPKPEMKQKGQYTSP